MVRAFEERDPAAATEPLDPQIEWDASRSPAEDVRGSYEGLEGVADFWRRWLSAWKTVEVGEPEFFDGGDKVLGWFAGQRNVGRRGIEVDNPPFGWLYTFQGDKIVRVVLLDKDEAPKPRLEIVRRMVRAFEERDPPPHRASGPAIEWDASRSPRSTGRLGSGGVAFLGHGSRLETVGLESGFFVEAQSSRLVRGHNVGRPAGSKWTPPWLAFTFQGKCSRSALLQGGPQPGLLGSRFGLP